MPYFLPPAGTLFRKAVISFLVLGPLLYGALGLYLGQDTSFDLRNYHWYNAYALVTGRFRSGIDFMPSSGQFFFNPLLDVSFYLLAAALPVKATYFIFGVFQGLNLCLLFFMSYLVLPVEKITERAAVSIITAIAGVTGGMALTEIGVCFGDNVTSIGILLSALIVIACAGSFQDLPYKKNIAKALAAGLPAGLMMGLKLTNATFCIGLCAGLLFITTDTRKNIAISFLFGLGVLAGFLVAYGYWGYYLYSHYQNPFFPFANQIFKSPFLMPGVSFGEARFGMPKDFFSFPFLFSFGEKTVTETFWRDFRVLAWYIFMGLAAFKVLALDFFPAARKATAEAEDIRNRQFIYLAAVSFISYLGWFYLFRIYRYLMPLEMLSPLLVLLCLHFIMPASRKSKIALSAAILAFLFISIHIPHYGRKDKWTSVTAVKGADAALPKNALLLMAGDRNPYAFMIPVFPSNISFVRLEVPGLGVLDAANRFTGKAFAQMIQQKIDSHAGSLMWFAEQNYGRRDIVLGAFNLKISGPCRSVTDLTTQITSKSKDYVPDPKFPTYPRIAVYDLCPVSKK